MSDENRIPHGHEEEETVSRLLAHLQELRSAVPVNYQLKAELKKELLERMKEADRMQRKQESALSGAKGKRLKWLSFGVLAAALVFVGFVWSHKNPVAILRPNVLTLPATVSAEQVDIDATGSRLAYVSAHSEIRTVLWSKGTETGTIRLHPYPSTYPSLSWANQGNQLAVVEQQGDVSRLWIMNLTAQNRAGSSRLLKEERGVEIHSPSWSPSDETIAYTRKKNGEEEIWVSSTVSFQEWKLAQGSQPEWSPDGRFLAYTRAGHIEVLELGTGKITSVGAGAWPSWLDATTLTYTTQKNELLEVSLDKQPPVSRDLTIRSLSDDKLVRASWSKEGTTLLLTQRDEQREGLVISLASR